MASWVIYDSWITFQMAPTTKLTDQIDWDSSLIKIALLDTAYVPNIATHIYWDDVLADEATPGGNYTTEGLTLTITDSFSSPVVTLNTATTVQWLQNASNPTDAQFAVLWHDSLVDGTSPLVAYSDLTGSAIDMTTGDLTIELGTADNGDIFTFTAS